MATDPAWRTEPVDLAPDVVLLPGFDGDGADPFLVPVNALVLGGDRRLLVIPGAWRAPWAPALAPVADAVRWVVSARPSPTPDLRLALARCRHAVALDGFPIPTGEPLAAGRFAFLDPPTAPLRSRAVLDIGRGVLYGGDGFGAPVLLPATDADDLDDALLGPRRRPPHPLGRTRRHPAGRPRAPRRRPHRARLRARPAGPEAGRRPDR